MHGRVLSMVMSALLIGLVTAPSAAGATGDSRGMQPAVQRLGETVLDAHVRGNVTYAATANVASYQQDAVITFAGRQYAAWYDADRTLVVSRRTLPTGEWQSLRLGAVLYADDSHNNITLGVSPRDGRLHVALATHTSRVRYLRSLPGLVTGAVAWRSTSFEPLAGHLPGAVGAPRSWTYPVFERHGDDLLLTWRDGDSISGRQALARYRDGAWNYLGTFTGPDGTWRGVHGTSTARYAYLHGFKRNPVTGDLEITWTWRESQSVQNPRCPDAPANRGLSYARSPDGGLTWVNEAGTVIGRTGSKDVITADDDQIVVDIDVAVGMINQESQATDSTGAIHVLTSQIDEEGLAVLGGCPAGDYYAARAAYARPVHHWRDAAGWHSTTLPFRSGNSGRAQLVFDAQDTAYAVLPDGRVAAAPADGGWSEWRIVFASSDVSSVSEQSIDRHRLAVDGVLTVVRQEKASSLHAASPLSLMDLRLSADGPALGDYSGRVFAAPPAADGGSAPVWPRLTATGEQPNFPARFAIDGDPLTRWTSGSAVTRTIDGIEWVTHADAGEAVNGGASRTRPQVLTIDWPTPRWVGLAQVDPGGRKGPKDWILQGRSSGRWVDLGRTTGQSATTRAVKLARTRVSSVRLVITAGNHPDTVQVADLAITDRVPDNRLLIRRVTPDKASATATMPVRVYEGGVLRVLDTARVTPRRLVVTAGQTHLTVAARGRTARALAPRACRATPGRSVSRVVSVRVRFTPTGGAPTNRTVKVALTRTC